MNPGDRELDDGFAAARLSNFLRRRSVRFECNTNGCVRSWVGARSLAASWALVPISRGGSILKMVIEGGRKRFELEGR
jgi:hypothetical protein